MIGYEEKLTALQSFVGRVQETAVELHVGYIVNVHADDHFTANESALVAPGTVTYIDHRITQEQK